MRRLFVAAMAALGLQLATPAMAQERVTLVLNWTPSGDHAPLYYAIQQGWYREAGVDLRLEIGRGSGASAARVGAAEGKHELECRFFSTLRPLEDRCFQRAQQRARLLWPSHNALHRGAG